MAIDILCVKLGSRDVYVYIYIYMDMEGSSALEGKDGRTNVIVVETWMGMFVGLCGWDWGSVLGWCEEGLG